MSNTLFISYVLTPYLYCLGLTPYTMFCYQDLRSVSGTTLYLRP